MRKWFLLFTILVLALIPIQAGAKGELKFQSVSVEIWPEYDQPSVLIIYHYYLAEDVSLPVALELLIPEKASINAVAVSDTSGSLITAPYTKSIANGWSVISMEAANRHIQVEFYDNYQLDGDTRQYEFVWPGNAAVDSFTLNFQQPVDVTSLQFIPVIGTGSQAADGLTYYTANIGSLELNETYTLNIEYTKTSTRLSGQVVTTGGSLDENVQGRVSFQEYLPWILGGLGGLLIISGLVWAFIYWRNEQKRNQRAARRKHTTSQTKGATAEAYCGQCGKRAQPGDVFCRSCGTRIKR